MVAVFLAAQLLAAQPLVRDANPSPVIPSGVAAAADSTYASPALRALVERVSRRNRFAPPALHSYRALVESEIAVVMRKADGSEGALSLEQSQNAVHWDRSGDYEQHMTGYRAQHVGPTISSLAVLTRAWTIPILYGNRLALFFGLDSAHSAPNDDRNAQRSTLAVHPFASDRDSIYRFSGGDTIAVLHTGRRAIPIARITVMPHATSAGRVVVFQGEVDVDAERGEIVRMRGAFFTLTHGRPMRPRIAGLPVDALAFVDLENQEVDGRFWLPRYQRIEAQVAVRALGDTRSVFRVVSRFGGQRVNADDSSMSPADGTQGDATAPDGDARSEPALAADTILLLPHRLTFASADSLRRPAPWRMSLGDATAGMHADDFLDLAPDAWRPTGAPLLEFRARRFSDYLHFNRVEGLATGLAAELRFRDRAPGATVRGALHYGWSERTARGRLEAEWQRGPWMPGARVERALDITNDFGTSFDSGGTLLAALASVDDYDYVDRTTAVASMARHFRNRSALARVQLGGGHDGTAVARLTQGLFRGDSSFRPNRGIDAGSYALAIVVLDYHPDVSAEFVRPGTGAQLRYTVAAGDLAWQRAEVRVTTRRNMGPFTYAARMDAGWLAGGSLPPQQLFELGRGEGLAGYGYKVFAGDRAALLRGLAMYRLPLWQAPLRLFGRPWLPAASPAIALGIQSGATTASSDAARFAIARLGTQGDGIGTPPLPSGSGAPLSTPTGGVRTSIDAGLRFFGGALGIGAARAIDHRAPWKLAVRLGQGL